MLTAGFLKILKHTKGLKRSLLTKRQTVQNEVRIFGGSPFSSKQQTNNTGRHDTRKTRGTNECSGEVIFYKIWFKKRSFWSSACLDILSERRQSPLFKIFFNLSRLQMFVRLVFLVPCLPVLFVCLLLAKRRTARISTLLCTIWCFSKALFLTFCVFWHS